MPSLSRTRLTLTFFAAIAFLPSLALAKDIKTTSVITKVTVFPNGAEITRLAKVELNEKGDHVLVLEGLPQYLNSNSLRVAGKTTGELEIGSVDHKIVFVQKDALDKTQRKAIEDQIQALKDRRDLLDSKIKITTTQKDLIEALAKLPSRPVHIHGENSAADKQDWGNLFDLMGEKLALTYTSLHETRIARRQVSKEIDELLKKLDSQPDKQVRQSIVRVNIKVMKPAAGQLTLRYQVRNAGWKPVYDARLVTTEAKPTLNLVRLASVYQNSGESWENVSLLLSTTRPAQGVSAPKLRPLSVEFASQIVSPASRGFGYADAPMMDKAQNETAMVQQKRMSRAMPAPAPKMRVARMRKARVNSYAFQTTFEIVGKVSIKDDGQRKKLKIISDDLKPDLEARSVPKRNTNAYLYANFELPKKSTPLLPGRLFLFRDGIFVGKGYLPQISPGEKHEMGFGIDDKIKVKFAELKRAKGETGLFTSSKTDKRQFKITVKNLHDKAVTVRIIDQIPYTTNELIKIELLPSTTKPTKKNRKDKRGILEWKHVLKAGQEDIIKLDYLISWPSKNNRLVYR